MDWLGRTEWSFCHKQFWVVPTFDFIDSVSLFETWWSDAFFSFHGYRLLLPQETTLRKMRSKPSGLAAAGNIHSSIFSWKILLHRFLNEYKLRGLKADGKMQILLSFFVFLILLWWTIKTLRIKQWTLGLLEFLESFFCKCQMIVCSSLLGDSSSVHNIRATSQNSRALLITPCPAVVLVAQPLGVDHGLVSIDIICWFSSCQREKRTCRTCLTKVKREASGSWLKPSLFSTITGSRGYRSSTNTL